MSGAKGFGPSEDETSLRSDSSDPALRVGFPPLAPGAIVAGRYRIVSHAGRGGMGEVYRVQDLTLDQEVALKFLPPELARDPVRLALFHQEVRLARRVAHKNVCRVFDIGEAEGRPFLSMEYVSGEDLASLLRRIGRLPEDKGLEMARQLCAGLAAAHEEGVLHRDLKPANVMIDDKGQVRITDFGIAGVAGEVKDLRSGTPAYMSPEQLKEEGVSERSDLYALGLVLYEIFTGRRAFEASSVPELLKAQADSDYPSPSSVVRDLSAATESAILRCLEPEPARRPASALALAAVLPGSDPLGEALAEGRTPSPELVAAAGVETALSARKAVSVLATVLVALGVLYVLRARESLLTRVPLDKPPEVLLDRAVGVLEELGRGGLPYEAHGFEVGRERPAAVLFWVRASPEPLIPEDGLRGRASRADPPLQVPGMAEVVVDSQGQLRSLVVVPEERSSVPAAGTEWFVLFQRAGLSLDDFTRVEPEWIPPVFGDERIAWRGVGENAELRVEAASLRGAPVSFRLIGPWTQPRESLFSTPAGGTRPLEVFVALVAILMLAGAVYLAYRNRKRGRGDRLRADRLAFAVFVLSLAGFLLAADHHADPRSELSLAIFAWIDSLFQPMLLWILYMALEPHVRRIWPRGLIGWTRLFSGKLRDPVVGKDLLAGMAAGAVMAFGLPLHELALEWSGAAPRTPAGSGVEGLLGARFQASRLIGQLLVSINNAFTLVLLFVLLWILLRRAWAALALLTAVLAIMLAAQTETVSAAGLFYLLPLVGAGAVTLWRFGFLSLTTAVFFEKCLRDNLFTFDLSRWYAVPTLLVLSTLAALAIFAFYGARGGEPPFGRSLLRD